MSDKTRNRTLGLRRGKKAAEPEKRDAVEVSSGEEAPTTSAPVRKRNVSSKTNTKKEQPPVDNEDDEINNKLTDHGLTQEDICDMSKEEKIGALKMFEESIKDHQKEQNLLALETAQRAETEKLGDPKLKSPGDADHTNPVSLQLECQTDEDPSTSGNKKNAEQPVIKVQRSNRRKPASQNSDEKVPPATKRGSRKQVKVTSAINEISFSSSAEEETILTKRINKNPEKSNSVKADKSSHVHEDTDKSSPERNNSCDETQDINNDELITQGSNTSEKESRTANIKDIQVDAMEDIVIRSDDNEPNNIGVKRNSRRGRVRGKSTKSEPSRRGRSKANKGSGGRNIAEFMTRGESVDPKNKTPEKLHSEGDDDKEIQTLELESSSSSNVLEIDTVKSVLTHSTPKAEKADQRRMSHKDSVPTSPAGVISEHRSRHLSGGVARLIEQDDTAESDVSVVFDKRIEDQKSSQPDEPIDEEMDSESLLDQRGKNSPQKKSQVLEEDDDEIYNAPTQPMQRDLTEDEETQPLSPLHLSVTGDSAQLDLNKSSQSDKQTDRDERHQDKRSQEEALPGTKRKLESTEEEPPSKRRPIMFDFELDLLSEDAIMPVEYTPPKPLINKSHSRKNKVIDRQQLFAPMGSDPREYAKVILNYFSEYRVLLRETQNCQPKVLPLGMPIVVGRHYARTLDVYTRGQQSYDINYEADNDWHHVPQICQTTTKTTRNIATRLQKTPFVNVLGGSGGSYSQIDPSFVGTLDVVDRSESQPVFQSRKLAIRPLRSVRPIKAQQGDLLERLQYKSRKKPDILVAETQDMDEESSGDEFATIPCKKKRKSLSRSNILVAETQDFGDENSNDGPDKDTFKSHNSSNNEQIFIPETQAMDSDPEQDNYLPDFGVVAESPLTDLEPNILTGYSRSATILRNATKQSTPIGQNKPSLSATVVAETPTGPLYRLGTRTANTSSRFSKSVLQKETDHNTSGSNYEDLFTDRQMNKSAKKIQSSKQILDYYDPALSDDQASTGNQTPIKPDVESSLFDSPKLLDTVESQKQSRAKKTLSRVKPTPEKPSTSIAESDDDVTVLDEITVLEAKSLASKVQDSGDTLTTESATTGVRGIGRSTRRRLQRNTSSEMNAEQVETGIDDNRITSTSNNQHSDVSTKPVGSGRRRRVIAPAPDDASTEEEDQQAAKKQKVEDDADCPMCFGKFTPAEIVDHAYECKGKNSGQQSGNEVVGSRATLLEQRIVQRATDGKAFVQNVFQRGDGSGTISILSPVNLIPVSQDTFNGPGSSKKPLTQYGRPSTVRQHRDKFDDVLDDDELVTDPEEPEEIQDSEDDWKPDKEDMSDAKEEEEENINIDEDELDEDPQPGGSTRGRKRKQPPGGTRGRGRKPKETKNTPKVRKGSRKKSVAPDQALISGFTEAQDVRRGAGDFPGYEQERMQQDEQRPVEEENIGEDAQACILCQKLVPQSQYEQHVIACLDKEELDRALETVQAEEQQEMPPLLIRPTRRPPLRNRAAHQQDLDNAMDDGQLDGPEPKKKAQRRSTSKKTPLKNSDQHNTPKPTKSRKSLTTKLDAVLAEVEQSTSASSKHAEVSVENVDVAAPIPPTGAKTNNRGRKRGGARNTTVSVKNKK